MITAGLRRAIGAAAGRRAPTRCCGRARRRAATRPACRSGSTPATPVSRRAARRPARRRSCGSPEPRSPGPASSPSPSPTPPWPAWRSGSRNACPACAESDALAGLTIPAPSAAVAGWPQARAALAAELTVRLAAAAGAIIGPERTPVPAPAPPPPGPVAEAIALRRPGRRAVRPGPDCRPAAGPPEAAVIARHVLANPAYAVRYAHAAAAAVLRWAAALGIRPAGFTPRLLAEPGELALLDALSWLPERVAAAARRGRPDEFAGYLAELAARTIDTMSTSSFRKIPDISSERLWLADAARTGLAAGLGLLGIAAPPRL